MTAHMSEIHVRYDKDERIWKVTGFRSGIPKPDQPEWTVRRWLKFFAMLYARGTARLEGTVEHPIELYEHAKDGHIIDRSTYPRSADPRRSKG